MIETRKLVEGIINDIIKNVPNKDLKAELDRREKELHKEKPKQRRFLDTAKLRKVCHEFINSVEMDGKDADTNYELWIFEVAMETVFEEGVLEWIREKMHP